MDHFRRKHFSGQFLRRLHHGSVAQVEVLEGPVDGVQRGGVGLGRGVALLHHQLWRHVLVAHGVRRQVVSQALVSHPRCPLFLELAHEPPVRGRVCGGDTHMCGQVL